MDTAPSLTPHHRTPSWLLPAVIVVILGLGAWYALSKHGPATNTNNANQVASNTNSATENVNGAANTSTVPADWLTYTSPTYGFAFRYPSSWTIVQEDDAAPKLTPKGATFYLEGAVDYPISFRTDARTPEAYVAGLPPDNFTRTTFNGNSGYHGYTVTDHTSFYIVQLPDAPRSLVFGYSGDLLGQTAGAPLSKDSLLATFEAVVRTLTVRAKE